MNVNQTAATEVAPRSDNGRVAVLLEPGRRGAAALAEAAAIAARQGAELTVVALAPRAGTVCRSCGGVSTGAYNRAARDEIAERLDVAIRQVRTIAPALEPVLLVEGDDPPLVEWIVQRHYDTVVLPSRLRAFGDGHHPSARPLRRRTGGGVRVVVAGRRNG